MKTIAPVAKKPTLKPLKNTTAVPKKRSLVLPLVVGGLLLLVIVAGVLFAVLRHQRAAENAWLEAADRARFAGIERDMRDASDLVASNLKNDVTLKNVDKACDYNSQKFSQGSVRCTVIFNYDKNINDFSFQEFSKLFAATKFLPNNESNNIDNSILELKSPDSATCDLVERVEIKTYAFRCMDDAIKPIYPLAE